MPFSDLALVGGLFVGLPGLDGSRFDLGGLQAGAVSGDGLFQAGGEVVEQVPSARDLRHSGLPAFGALGEGTSAVTADRADVRVLAEPAGEGVGRVVGQNVDGAAAVHVDEDGAEAPAPAERELVHTEYGQLGYFRQVHGADQPQQRGSAHRDGQVLGEAFARLSAQRQRHLSQGPLECQLPCFGSAGVPGVDVVGVDQGRWGLSPICHLLLEGEDVARSSWGPKAGSLSGPIRGHNVRP